MQKIHLLIPISGRRNSFNQLLLISESIILSGIDWIFRFSNSPYWWCETLVFLFN